MLPALVLSFALVVSLLASPTAASPTSEGAGTFHTTEGCWQRLPLDRADLATTDPPPPVGALVPCPGIRPGAQVWITGPDGTSGCTLNFVFRGTSYDAEGLPVDEGLFIGTAGHCVLDEDTEKTWAPGQGAVATDGADKRFGEVSYAIQVLENGKNFDFALIRVDDDREAEVKPGLCHFGGPSGMSSTWHRGDVVHHFGQGLVYGETVQGRSGVVSFNEAEGSALTFVGSALFGDSGSALIEADGDALGVVVAILPPLVFSTPIAMQVERAEKQLAMDLELVEAPFV